MDQATPDSPAQQWKTIGRGPHVAVAGFAFDRQGRFPLIYRGPAVRSAKNAWSLPSGLHEQGLSLAEQFATELKEELNIEAFPATCVTLGVYENIAAEDGYHWVIVMLAISVLSLDAIVNKEPDKHPEIRVVEPSTFDPEQLTWTPCLKDFLVKNWPAAQLAHGNMSWAWPTKPTTPS